MLRNGADIAGTLRQQHIAGAQVRLELLKNMLRPIDKQRLKRSLQANAAAQAAAVSAGDRVLTGGLDIQQRQRIGAAQYLDEIFVKVASTGVAVRLI